MKGFKFLDATTVKSAQNDSLESRLLLELVYWVRQLVVKRGRYL